MSTIVENILNVTLIEPKLKHPTIFVRFDELNEGENLIIHNDHDPKPLYYQLLGERGNIFTWEYLEQGPELWKVKISKRVSGEQDETLGQIAAKDLRKTEIFKKYGLDFCCGGKKTVKEACAEKGLDVAQVEQELLQADKTFISRPIPYNDWALDFLVDYIVNTHHSYVKKTLPELVGYASKVATVHGQQHPELFKIKTLVDAVNSELLWHMIKEEKELFPHIKAIVFANENGRDSNAALKGIIKNHIDTMEIEHEIVGKCMDEINVLSSNYTVPADGCASYSLLYNMLDEFENDLHLHIHLENNILFPKASEMESKLS
ncbi:MAG: iron-sulfur cluster repair di-iron protein [bacterium]|nr:iron-sulfur cluster repair di-iron protein [bacterium]